MNKYETRFKQLRIEMNEARKDEDPKSKNITAIQLGKFLNENGWSGNPKEMTKIENGYKDVAVRPDLLLAYKKYFGVTIDWLVDDSEPNRHFEGDIAIASKTTGLSEETIRRISDYDDYKKDLINKLVSSNKIDSLSFLLSTIFEYAYSKYSTVNVKNNVLDTEKEYDYRESRAFLTYDAVEAFKMILHEIDELYEGQNTKLYNDKIDLLKKEIALNEEICANIYNSKGSD